MSKTLPMQTIRTTPTEQLEMGDRVYFHHRAGVARYKRLVDGLDDIGWKITMGVNEDDGFYPGDPLWADVPNINDAYWNHIRFMFAQWPRARVGYGGSLNKTVMVWPQIGYGWIIGSIRKSIGISERGSSNSYNGEFEPGYHSSDMYVDLYVVKESFYGIKYILCPTWGVQRI